jgi:hypothetical protein
LEFLLILAVVAGVVFIITGPLRRSTREEDETLLAQRAELEAERDAKYREIRDAELDFRTGKLSEADWRVQDRTLRSEAVELLKRLDAVSERVEPLP